MAEMDKKKTVETPPDEVVVVDDGAALPADRPRKVYSGMWGPFEIGAMAAGALAIVTVLVVYFFFVIPSNRQLETNRSEADRLDAELLSANSKYGDITNTQTQVDKLLGSVDDFQMRYLPVASVGQNTLYQRLNGLISSYDLVNTSGPDYAALDAADTNNEKPNDEERGRSKFRSLFPGVYVTMTVEGSYQNLRRFIRDIETGQEFVIISSIELAPSDTERQNKVDNTKPPVVASANPGTGNPGMSGTTFGPGGSMVSRGAPVGQPVVQNPSQPQGKKGKMHGEIVSLHLEMAAYFRRPGLTATATQY